MKKYHATIKVSGNKEDLNEFFILCKKIEYLRNVGASREIPIHVDGDGSASLSFEGIKGDIDKKQFEEEIDKGGKLSGIFIGE